MKETEKAIPEITISDNKVVLPTKEVLLVINGEEKKIIIQKLQAGLRRDLAKKYLNTKIVGQQVQGSMDPSGFQIGILSKVIIEAPFETDENTIASFPDNVIDYLYNEYNEWAGDSKKNLD